MHILNINCLGLGPNSSKIFCNFRWSYPHWGQSLTKVAFEFHETFRLHNNYPKKYFLFSRTFFSFELYDSDCVKFINAQGYLQSISGQSLGNLWTLFITSSFFFAALSNQSLVSANTFSFVPKLIVNKIWDWILWVHNAVLASL